MKKELHWIYGMALFLAMGIVFLALFAPWIAPYDPTAVSTEEILEGMSSSHWLGTDALGRDILSRTIYGARTSVAFAFVAAFCTMVLGLMLGILSGYFGGWVDRGIQCLVAVFQGLPGMSLMIAVAAILPENNFRLIIALTLTSWAGFSRIVRSEVIRIRGELYNGKHQKLGGIPWVHRKEICTSECASRRHRAIDAPHRDFAALGFCAVLLGTGCFSSDGGLGRHDF